jgi:hypothetical protein
MARTIRIVSVLAVLSLALLAIPFRSAEVLGTTGPSNVWVAPPPLGSNSNSGTETHPFATIQKGIDEVAYNGTVHVAAGTYHENLSINSAQDLAGAGAQYTIINGGGLGRVLYISSAPSENCISGFTIQNGNMMVASLWNPDNSQVLFAGINSDFIKTLPRLFNYIGEGGGIYIGGSHIVTLNDCTIKDNQADFGGGIYNIGQLHMNRCTMSDNSATEFGGGIRNEGQMWLDNCTISGNHITHEEGGGGGIWNGDDMTLVNCTIAYNSAGSATNAVGGGFLHAYDYTASFKNTIVANNTAGNHNHNNGYITYPPITSQGYNLDSENSCGFDQPTDLTNTNPLLSPLQDNGGPTFTHALLHGSPAIDNGGDPGTTDQRGVPRPQGPAFDIGAYELAQASVTTSTDTGTASFSTLNGYITDLTALDESELDCMPNGNLDFPHGLFSFTITGITPGSSVTVVIILPSDMPTDTEYWKCINGQWVDATSILGSNNGDSVITLTLTDGGPFDADGQANGTIVDPGGPALVFVAPAPTPIRPPIPKPAQMAVQYLGITPQQTSANQPVTISTNVVNTGDQPGSLNVVLEINGKVEQTKLVSLGPHGTQPIKFTVTRAQPGTYTVDIDGQKGSFTISGTGGTSSSDRMIGILIAIGALVLAVAVVVWLLIRRPA